MGEPSSETNLIDFSYEDLPEVANESRTHEISQQQKKPGSMPTPEDPNQNSHPPNVPGSVQMSSPVKTNKSSKSFFEITRVETGSQGEGKGDDMDSELDDTMSEAFDTSRDTSGSNTPLPSLDNSAGSIDNDIISKEKPPATVSSSQPPAINQRSSTVTSSSVSTTTSNAGTNTEGNPTSRFRIVKIAKPTPYDRGRWKCKDDDKDTKTASDNSHAKTDSNSPTVSSNRPNNDEHTDKGRVVSPNELVKGTSSEQLSHSAASQSHAAGVNKEISGMRRQSSDSVSTTTSEAVAGDTTLPVVDALEAAFEQIQTIKESLLRTAVDEWRSLRTSLHSREGENDHLREENRILKEENRVLRERLHNLEMRLQTLEKG